jgi:glutamine synthetase
MSAATIKCEYIWLDGADTPQLRSKTRVLNINSEDEDWKLSLADIPVWGFDGSSTGQATTQDSDCVLRPVFACVDSNRQNGILVLCDVLNSDLTPHASNSRAKMIDAMIAHGSSEPFLGFEQEYFLFNTETNLPLGWKEGVEPSPQGPYYCGVGGGRVEGRSVSELHLTACLGSGLSIVGVNAEVALGQWEFQIGGPGVNAVATCDHLWVSRFILNRIAETRGLRVELDPKPISGDWNGSGMHTNVSTKDMRHDGGMKHITTACNKLGEPENLEKIKDFYGEGLERRLTGEHETSSVEKFNYGVSDRSASIRIPWHVEKQGKGYLEDRRPNSNADPYKVGSYLLSAIEGGTETDGQ